MRCLEISCDIEWRRLVSEMKLEFVVAKANWINIKLAISTVSADGIETSDVRIISRAAMTKFAPLTYMEPVIKGLRIKALLHGALSFMGPICGPLGADRTPCWPHEPWYLGDFTRGSHAYFNSFWTNDVIWRPKSVSTSWLVAWRHQAEPMLASC